MDHWVRRNHQLKACCFLASLAFVTLFQVVKAPGPTPGLDQQQQQHSAISGSRKGRQLLSNGNCESRANSGELLIVSTLNGDISALDLSHGGKLAWSLEAEEGPLLSSSISQLEIQGPEGKFKVVPSLDGGLFKWNDEEVEPVPFSADTLLSSSFKIYDDLVMVGGKESITYGINAKTGKTRYACSSEGCNTFLQDDSEDMDEEEDIVVIQRNQQTVRAVEQRTGAEKWNFSVGQHEISFLVGEAKECKSTDPIEDEDEDHTCITEDQEGKIEDPMMKVFMSPGAVVALSRDGTHTVLWKQDFSCAIANAWIIRGGIVEQMDIFASSLPALTSTQPPGSPSLPEPVMYLDMYQNQLYVQTTKVVRDALDYNAMLETANSQGDDHALVIPKVKWRPYYSTPSRTPIMIAHDRGDSDEEDLGSGAMALYNQYPFDTGYYPQYLYLDQTPKEWEDVMRNARTKKTIGVDGNKSGDDLVYLDLLTMSIWNWWKEILSISMFIAISMQLFWHFVKKSTKPERGESMSSETNTGDVDEVAGVAAEEMPATIKQVERAPSSFKSRYLTDFEHQECLGKGGFGIVFQAKNKVDENSYAVKRITLPNREEAREKVLREARALARLDHSGIVRYFNSWLEEPPIGWQELNDKHILDHGDGLSDTVTSNATSATPCTFNKDSHLVRDTKQFAKRTHTNSHHSGSFIDPIVETTESADEIQNPIKKVASIVDNIIYPNTWDMLDSSTGFPSGLDSKGVDKDESGSFSIEFQAVEESNASDSDSELNSTAVFSQLGDYLETSTPRAMASISSTSGSAHSEIAPIPFQQYSPLEDTDSVQIVFEDSGCADKEDQSLDHSLSSSPTQTDSAKTDDTSKRQSAGLHRPELVQSGLHRNGGHEQNTSEKMFTFHTTIPRVYLYIQMQLCQKETLKDWLSSNTLSRDRTRLLHIFDQILEAVHYVHGCGMIHRDLKPSNIFFSLNGTIKIGDFGLVTAIDTDTDPDSDASSDGGIRSPIDRRHTGQVGTQLYMSPEQLSGGSYDYKVDIFSLGLIFFELLHPFSTQMERIKILTTARQIRFPLRFTKELPTEAQFAKWLLSASPEKRPDATEITQSELFSDMYRDFVPPRPNGARQRYSSNSSN
ncbi:eukaryotic translation initiation factor 2-alpha kinase 3-like [Amphiura filiformis]|uniref:eukaryotic translation initiation factor 2-alpha kinase 3-like n=1 Tax=Amphiura filiformis TaxID=82378 RepID=UPI003B210A51